MATPVIRLLSLPCYRIKGLTSDLIGQLDSTSDGRDVQTMLERFTLYSYFAVIVMIQILQSYVSSDDWEMSHQNDCDTDKLTGLEDFGLLLRPLGLTEKKLVPDPITFTEPDPLGALVYSSADTTSTAAPKGILMLSFAIYCRIL